MRPQGSRAAAQGRTALEEGQLAGSSLTFTW